MSAEMELPAAEAATDGPMTGDTNASAKRRQKIMWGVILTLLFIAGGFVR
jgi:hypothetical protein